MVIFIIIIFTILSLYIIHEVSEPTTKLEGPNSDYTNSDSIENIIVVVVFAILLISSICYTYYWHNKRVLVTNELKEYFTHIIDTYDNSDDAENILKQYVSDSIYLSELKDSNLDMLDDNSATVFYIVACPNSNLYLGDIRITINRKHNHIKV